MTARSPDRQILMVHSHYGTPPAFFTHAEQRGHGFIRREIDLTAADFEAASGLLTTNHLDQIGFLRWSDAVEAMLDRDGRWFFNGHFLRKLVEGLGIYVPIRQAKRTDLVLTRLAEHPIFAGIDQSSLEERKGVAGFYGRGYNPLPEGALAINGVGPDRLPVDWEWQRPNGGRIFSHAGNDLGGMGQDLALEDTIASRIIDWTRGGLGA